MHTTVSGTFERLIMAPGLETFVSLFATLAAQYCACSSVCYILKDQLAKSMQKTSVYIVTWQVKNWNSGARRDGCC
jgi:hypothetical protein